LSLPQKVLRGFTTEGVEMNESSFSNERAEWLEADGLGGFASGTVCGIRTRRYHALLLAATAPPAGRMVLVNGFDAEIDAGAGPVAISTQRYLPGVDAPDGASRLEDFTPGPWPRWTFRLPDGRGILQEIFVPRGDGAAVVLRWTLLETGSGPADCSLRVRPFFSGRDFHALHHENPVFNFAPENLAQGQRWTFYPGVPPVRALTNGDYVHEPAWYRNFLYDEEEARGLDTFLVPKLHLGTLLAPREIPFRADRKIGNGVASASAFPNGVWERGTGDRKNATVIDRRYKRHYS
jgi:predicted glycogen debranching enzyme